MYYKICFKLVIEMLTQLSYFPTKQKVKICRKGYFSHTSPKVF